jgi:hypothetical protein
MAGPSYPKSSSTRVSCRNALADLLLSDDATAGRDVREVPTSQADVLSQLKAGDQQRIVAATLDLQGAIDVGAFLPLYPVEPSTLLCVNEGPTASVLFEVVAPPGVSASTARVRYMPSYVRLSDQKLVFEISLSKLYPLRSRTALNCATSSLAMHAHIGASFIDAVGSAHSMTAQLCDAAGGDGVLSVALPLPARLLSGACLVRVDSITVASENVSLGVHRPIPAIVPVIGGGLRPTQRLEDAANFVGTAPSVSRDGTLYVPKWGTPAGCMLVFGRDGERLAPLSLEPLGLSGALMWGGG